MIITKENYIKLRDRICTKENKHRYRTNNYGVSWCIICGQLSNKMFQKLGDDEQLNII